MNRHNLAQKARAAARSGADRRKKVQDAVLILHVYRGFAVVHSPRRTDTDTSSESMPSRLRHPPATGKAAYPAQGGSYPQAAAEHSQTRSALSGTLPTTPTPSPFQAAAACRLACARSGRLSGRATAAPFPLRHITPPVVTPQLLHWIMATFSMACAITSTTGLPPQKGQALKTISHISSPPS